MILSSQKNMTTPDFSEWLPPDDFSMGVLQIPRPVVGGGYTLGIIPPFNMPRKHAKTNHPNKTEAAQSSAKFEKKNI